MYSITIRTIEVVGSSSTDENGDIIGSDPIDRIRGIHRSPNPNGGVESFQFSHCIRAFNMDFGLAMDKVMVYCIVVQRMER